MEVAATPALLASAVRAASTAAVAPGGIDAKLWLPPPIGFGAGELLVGAIVGATGATPVGEAALVAVGRAVGVGSGGTAAVIQASPAKARNVAE